MARQKEPAIYAIIRDPFNSSTFHCCDILNCQMNVNGLFRRTRCATHLLVFGREPKPILHKTGPCVRVFGTLDKIPEKRLIRALSASNYNSRWLSPKWSDFTRQR
ncbi:hypothetical protein CEXT_299241 [Caerostris extrusa]|uniref:Uncharacterized protein n=1 Tax=Caerostris extrusa TaxID=172846 RepID=A0AAV4WM40_CAEEX|nr:hypothetical protein CEXT_299241 [Caerostris extrusa]